MNDTATEMRSVILERELPYPPEKIWRALTQPEMMEEWLMKTDFQPTVDHRFHFSADWGKRTCLAESNLEMNWSGFRGCCC